MIAVSDLPLCTIKFCSVVFGVTLRLLVINTLSCASREQQTTPFTSDECYQLATVQQLCVYTLTTRDEARYWSRIAILKIPLLFSTECTNVTDGQTNRQTPRDDIGRHYV